MLVQIFSTISKGMRKEKSLCFTWVNTYHKMPFHSHGNSVVSGLDSKKHEPIKFASPADVADMKPYLNSATDKLTKYNTTIASVPYEEGDVLLWDSYLRHGVSNDAVGDRITLSFNAVPTIIDDGLYSMEIKNDF